MNDQPNQKRNLSDISHLFLSDVRDKGANGAASSRPQRIGPKQRAAMEKPAVSIDLTPEEFAQVIGEGANAPKEIPSPIAPVTAIIGSHLNGKQFDRVKEYARHLAAGGARIGLIELDASEFRLMCFDRNAEPQGAEVTPAEVFDTRQMIEAMEELNCDINRWLLLVPNPRVAEAKPLLKLVDHWVLLTTCDHDGVVSSYRTLKGLADVNRPRLSLAMLDAPDNSAAGQVFRKVSSVCQQFLNWSMETEGCVRAAHDVSGHLVMYCRPVHDKAQLAAAPQWDIVNEFLSRARIEPQSSTETQPMHTMELESLVTPEAESNSTHVADVVIPFAATEPKVESKPVAPAIPFAAPVSIPTPQAASNDKDNVIDLVGNDSDASILSAVLKRSSEFVETPIKAPMCPGATLTVSRDRELVLHVISKQGLADLRGIGQAYRWVTENRSLVAMALPQFAIDSHAMPKLRLLVDHSDMNADLLQPMLQSNQVTVQSYRKLKWGGKTGLLLEAA